MSAVEKRKARGKDLSTHIAGRYIYIIIRCCPMKLRINKVCAVSGMMTPSTRGSSQGGAAAQAKVFLDGGDVGAREWALR